VTALALEGVTAGYGGGRPVVRDVDLRVEPGERIALVGPNGAGKSTILRLLTGLIRPSAGRVSLGDDGVDRLSRDVIAHRIAVVPQVAALPFAMRVEEVVALGRLPHEDALRGPRSADRAAIAAAIERVGLGRLIGRDARELSLGERQLVLLALAIAQSAPIVVLDEPTVHLDIRHQVDVMELLLDLNERDRTTVVAVMHDLHLVTRFFPRVAVLGSGRLVADGPPDEVLTGALVRAVFDVDPAVLPPGPWSAALFARDRPTARSASRSPTTPSAASRQSD
jgi:iron complex transport system ATP-binding protein